MQEVVTRLDNMEKVFIEALTLIFDRLTAIEDRFNEFSEAVAQEPEDDLVADIASRLDNIKADTSHIRADADALRKTLLPKAC